MASLNVVNQKEYLRKYLGLGKAPGEKKKRKKKDKDSDRRLKIIDDDIDEYMSTAIQMDIEASDEDSPQIVAVIDDRPPSLRVDEKTNTLLWKPLGEDNEMKPEILKKMSSFQLKNNTLENKSNILSSKKMYKEFLKKKSEKASGSEEDHNKDMSTSFEHLAGVIKKKDPSLSEMETRNAQRSPLRNKYGNLSPVRIIKQEHIDDNENHSPPRRGNSTYTSNDRKHDAYDSRNIKQESSDIEYSSSRKDQRHNNDSDISPLRRDQRLNNDSNSSLPRRDRKQDSDSDISPARRKSNKDISPPRRARRRSEDSDNMSHSRIKQKDSFNTVDRDISPSRKRLEGRYRDEDMSPQRKKENSRRNNDYSSPRQEHSRSRKNRSERDISPPRRKRVKERDSTTPRRVKELSPPRKKIGVDKDNSPVRKVKRNRSYSPDKRQRDRQTGSRWGDWSPDHDESRNCGKPEKTMSGKRAGLQSAKELSKEIATLKEKEDRVFQNMSEEVSGKNATTIVRGQKPKDLEEEAQKLKKEKEIKEKYDRWGKGLKQVESENQRMADQLYEMSKPLARYADDEDLEKFLKEQEREGDPMLNYIRKKKKKKNVDSGIPEKPMYMGEFMPNRYGIRPGYRWDGVDRSNDYEKRWYEKFNARKALQDEAFKWSTEDM